ncbi:Saccharopine dehydrogenase-like oxidoreductase [Abortiporus biennis]
MVDILVIGATGYTGRLIVEYLNNHPERSSFTFGIAGRSRTKLDGLVSKLQLSAGVKSYVVDVQSRQAVDEIVGQAKVIVSCVGPYWLHGETILGSCVRQGKHYVDVAGEPAWIRDMIYLYDFNASRTGAIIINTCGFDSVPSDASVFISSRTLKEHLGPDTQLENSISGFDTPSNVSGGTMISMLTALEKVPQHKQLASMQDFGLSTAVQGVPSHPLQLTYKIPFSKPTTYGSFFPIIFGDRAIVQRTWGCFEQMSIQPWYKPTEKERSFSYGPRFKYDLCAVSPGRSWFSAILNSLAMYAAVLALLLPPVRWILKKTYYPSGEGPSESVVKNGHVIVTNVTTSVPTPSKPKTSARTTIEFKGNSYLLTATTVGEAALTLLFNHDDLTPYAKQGGLFTPMSGLGDVFLKRWENWGDSSILG